MTLLYEKTYETLQLEIMQEITNSTSIDRDTPGAKARTISQAIARKLNRAYQDFDINFLRTFLPFAQGRFLDYIGDMLGVQRLPATIANTSEQARLVKYFVSTGTFGDLNSGNNISVPAGTLISTLPGNEGIVYRLTTGTVLLANSSEQFVSVQATRDGINSNVGRNSLIYSTFNSYTAGTGLKVTNVGLIASGRNIENDDNYKFRISKQVLAAESANETACRLAVLNVPGVSNVVSKPYYRGIGTFDFLVQTVIPNTPSEVINSCQEALERVQAYGISGKAVRPRLTGMSFQISITWRNDATNSDKVSIRRNISTAIQNYINNLSIQEEFIRNELIQRILDISDKIKNVGTAAQPIDLVYIYRESQLQDNNIREEVIGDYTPSPDERLIIEESLETPITIIDLN